MNPRDLVCARCWRDFFNTEAFEKCCTREYPSVDNRHDFIEITIPVKEITDAGCSWCAYIKSFIDDSWMPEDTITTYLRPSTISSCTPQGGNVFYLSISCHSPMGKWISGYSLFLHAWTAANDKASKYVTARPLQTDVNSEAARMQLRTWLEECRRHECCSISHGDSILPTRVIEISPRGRKHPRLLESGNLRGVYATLSYCWGETLFPTLNRSNYSQFIEELDMLALPLTIRNAISTARDLSIPYLWIDALCIIQDSVEDKTREVALMKDIYASSTLTIVAASAKSVFEGFFHPRVYSETFYRIPVRIRSNIFGTMFVNELDAACYDERSEPIARRAWTMQEQLLAQRILTFTSHTMMWKCHAGIRNFGDSLYFPHDLDSGYNDDNEKYSLNLHSLLLSEEEACLHRDKALSCWLRVVTAYSLRTMSLEGDKLNALAGIASHPSFSRALGPSYFAGLWQYGLAKQLAWRTAPRHRTLPEDDTFIFYRPAMYRAPSWSWASLEGGIIHFNFSFDDENEDVPDVICDVIDCSTRPISPKLNPFGEIASAQLRIKAVVRMAWFNPSTSNIFLLSVSISAGPRIIVPNNEELITIAEAEARHIDDFVAKHPDVDLVEDPGATNGTGFRNMYGTYDETGNYDPVIVLCVAITLDKNKHDGVNGILLLPSEVKNDSNLFRRIGFFERGRNEDFQREAKTEISII
ncbi:hypothetical protein B7463_g9998, partial [Scytalidium lignicola]